MRILVVEDDPALANILVRILKDDAYAVDLATDGQEGEWLAFENPYDLVVLDLMLPVKDGFGVLKAIREAGNSVPVLILTAKDTKEDIVKGLDLGADDYLTKPFDVEEFSARCRALMRRQEKLTNNLIKVGPLEIDTAKKSATFRSEVIDLTAKEYGLLEYFARNAGSVLSRVQLAEHVWDQNFEPESNVVDVYIGYLRAKIDKHFNVNAIKTVRGHGYMLDAELTSTLEAPGSRPQAESHAP